MSLKNITRKQMLKTTFVFCFQIVKENVRFVMIIVDKTQNRGSNNSPLLIVLSANYIDQSNRDFYSTEVILVP